VLRLAREDEKYFNYDDETNRLKKLKKLNIDLEKNKINF
jgi:hypothetical protein